MEYIDPDIISKLRRMWLEGVPASELLRFLDSKDIDSVHMIQSFRSSFGLDFGDASCISGWFADGTGELNDEQIHNLLAPAIDAKRSEWE